MSQNAPCRGRSRRIVRLWFVRAGCMLLPRGQSPTSFSYPFSCLGSQCAVVRRAHSALRFAALRTGYHFLISACCNAQRASARGGRKQGNRLEIFDHVIGQWIDRAVGHVASPETKAQRVAIRRRASHMARPYAPVCAGDVLDDGGLTKRKLQRLSQDAAQRVQGATRRKRTDQRYWSRRIGLRSCNAYRWHHRSQQCSEYVPPHRLLHNYVIPLMANARAIRRMEPSLAIGKVARTRSRSVACRPSESVLK